MKWDNICKILLEHYLVHCKFLNKNLVIWVSTFLCHLSPIFLLLFKKRCIQDIREETGFSTESSYTLYFCSHFFLQPQDVLVYHIIVIPDVDITFRSMSRKFFYILSDQDLFLHLPNQDWITSLVITYAHVLLSWVKIFLRATYSLLNILRISYSL